MGTRTELRNQKRKEVVEAIVIRQEPVHLVARIDQIPQRTIFDWLSLYRSGGWEALKASHYTDLRVHEPLWRI